MRRLLTLVLLLLFGLPLAASLLALRAGEDAQMPACCRRAGRHHCAMGRMEKTGNEGAGARVKAPVERCPYAPQGVVGGRRDLSAAPVAEGFFAGLVSHPAGTPQTESMWRLARERARGKRGPPAA